MLSTIKSNKKSEERIELERNWIEIGVLIEIILVFLLLEKIDHQVCQGCGQEFIDDFEHPLGKDGGQQRGGWQYGPEGDTDEDGRINAFTHNG